MNLFWAINNNHNTDANKKKTKLELLVFDRVINGPIAQGIDVCVITVCIECITGQVLLPCHSIWCQLLESIYSFDLSISLSLSHYGYLYIDRSMCNNKYSSSPKPKDCDLGHISPTTTTSCHCRRLTYRLWSKSSSSSVITSCCLSTQWPLINFHLCPKKKYIYWQAVWRR